ncbi:hypothetical protein [Gordonia sp. (in: high G+C Gram-positive bacteria)]|uniref:hypothetical protein n=1 Tax=Gordonia sp. (in: high G+C Gram-positive bacteria) TaxID=84139 RepID=UPI003C781132
MPHTHTQPLYKGGSESRNLTTRAGEVSPEKPDRCERHQDTLNPPSCGACAARRGDLEREKTRRITESRAAEAQRQQHANEAAERQAAEREEAVAATRDAIANCNLCDDNGYGRDRAEVCTHNPSHAKAARRGLDLVRAALDKPKEHTN